MPGAGRSRLQANIQRGDASFLLKGVFRYRRPVAPARSNDTSQSPMVRKISGTLSAMECKVEHEMGNVKGLRAGA
jgi:hypothetical protein